jgi:hypothetical protein
MLKEAMEESRAFVKNFIALLLMCGTQQYLVLTRFKKLFRTADNIDGSFVTSMLNMSLVALSIISITFIANSTLNRSIDKEKKNKSIIILIALGIKPQKIWGDKTILCFIIGYISYIIILILNIFAIKNIFKFEYIVSIKNLVSFIIIGPLVSVSLVIILSFIFWYFKNNSMTTLIYTMTITFGTWILMNFISSPITLYNSSMIVLFITLLPVFLYYVFSQIINKQEKWKLGLF